MKREYLPPDALAILVLDGAGIDHFSSACWRWPAWWRWRWCAGVPVTSRRVVQLGPAEAVQFRSCRISSGVAAWSCGGAVWCSAMGSVRPRTGA